MSQIDLKDPKAVADFIRKNMATGGVCHRRVLCQTCEILLIDTFEPASFVQVTIEQAKP